MAVSIIEKVLGNNKFYTDAYIKDTITLVKSITVKNDKEARLYNDYLKQIQPNFVEEDDRGQWQYYRHLVGQPYTTDRPIIATSVDNGEEFTFNKDSMLVHRRTHEELLKFGLYYEELVRRYPELELYIKGVITTPVFTDVQQIIDAEDFTIVSYAKHLVEENEHDVMPQLQLRIDSYKSTWLMGFYAMVDNLFLASQYHILYNFLCTSLLSIRLANAKTNNAHSYHIRLYLASHHYLDDVLLFLTKSQQLFLYRNMLYLNNHAGSNFTFQTLIDVLFSERNISVINYVYQQRNTVNNQGLMQYRYRQKLLNTKKLVINTADMSLETVGAKERDLAPGNGAVYDYNLPAIDFRHRNALFSELLTKDLETILLDETDSVKYKLLQILTDSWARLLVDDRVSFLVEISDPTSSISTRMGVRDLFKLYLVVLYASQGISLKQFPTYRIQRVFKQVLPDVEDLLKGCYDMDSLQRDYLHQLLELVPAYQYYLTSYQFEQYVTMVYKLNIGLWTALSNYSDMDTEGQMSWAISQVHEHMDFDVDTVESVDDFLDRTGLSDPRGYDTVQLQTYLFDILDNAYDKKLSFLSRFQKLQDALTKVFFKFNSYTVQLINNYYADAPLLVGAKDTRYAHTDSTVYDLTLAVEGSFGHSLITDQTSSLLSMHHQPSVSDIRHHSKLGADIEIDGVLDFDIQHTYQTDQLLPLTQLMLTEVVAASRDHVDATMLDSVKFSPANDIASMSFFTVGVTSSFQQDSLLVENTLASMPINIGFAAKTLSTPPTQSSESDLLFLAINL